MKKILAFLMASVMMLSVLSGCSGSQGEQKPEETPNPSAEPITIKLGVPTAPPTLPILHMMEENLLGDNVTIELDVWNAPEQLIAMVQDSEHDMFAFPLTVVAKLYNNGMDVRLMNVNTWG